MLRALFRPFALHAAYTPIETIVFFSIVGTLAYFHLLNAIKVSYKAAHRPVYVGYRLGEWLAVGPRKYVDAEIVALETIPNSFQTVCYKLNGECFSFQNMFGFKPNTYHFNHWTLSLVTTRIRNADGLDIILILLGYVLMNMTFYLLLSRSRSLGSSFFLPLAILSSAILSLLIALPIAIALKIPIDPIALSEALPFLVCTVGFDKPLRLARAVFLHPHLSIPPCLLPNSSPDPLSGYPILHPPSSLPTHPHPISPSPLKPGPKIITESLSYVYSPIIRDYLLEIAVLTVGAYSRVRGLREVCALAALVLAIDCLLMCTYFAAILGVMVEVRRISLSKDSARSRASTLSSSPTPLSRASSFLLGEKGASLYNLVLKRGKLKVHPKPKKENPVARLKLLLIISFLVLHILNFITPLAPSKHTYSSPYYLDQDSPSKVDLSSPSIRAMLAAFAEAKGPTLSEDSYVKIYPPARSFTPKSFNFPFPSLTDPILSKSLFAVLILSVVLNGYLLRGIASGLVGNPGATLLGGTSDQPVNCRFEDTPEPHKERPQLKVETSLIRLEDVDWKLRVAQEQREKEEEKEKEKIPPPLSSTSCCSTETLSVPTRTLEECVDLFEKGPRPLSLTMELLSDEEIILLSQNGHIAPYALEKVLGTSTVVTLERAVRIRRALISRASFSKTLETSEIPLSNYDYTRVLNACCENVVGYIPIPLGIAGPLLIDSTPFPIPMATAEGTLVASTSRGCKALNLGGGVRTVIVRDGMTRGPAVEFPSVIDAGEALRWLESEEGKVALRGAFEGTSRFARLIEVKGAMAGRILYVRFRSTTGDAMGMNMVSKGTEKALEAMRVIFPCMRVLTLSGNYCTDKKPAAINWIDGRGKSVVAEAVVPGEVVKKVLKSTVEELVELNVKKNLVGSAMAGSVGGFNAHAANVLTAVYLATGQDPAQNVESSQCLTFMEAIPSPLSDTQTDLLVTLTMPCLELGTVGGGTSLLPQSHVLDMLGIKGAHPSEPGENARTLARVVVGGVMAGELSLLGALRSGELIRAHMRHNRSAVGTPGRGKVMP